MIIPVFHNAFDDAHDDPPKGVKIALILLFLWLFFCLGTVIKAAYDTKQILERVNERSQTVILPTKK